MPAQQTQRFTVRARPEDVERLRDLRDQLQARTPLGRVSMADALSVAVGSASAALASGSLPEALSSPQRAA
jgi:hypothetical protein